MKASREVAEFTQTHTHSHRGNHYFVLHLLAYPWTWYEWESAHCTWLFSLSVMSVKSICPHRDWVAYDQIPYKRQLQRGIVFCLVWFLIHSLWLQSIIAGEAWQQALLVPLEAGVWVRLPCSRLRRQEDWGMPDLFFFSCYSIQDPAHRMVLPTLDDQSCVTCTPLDLPRLAWWMKTRRLKKGQTQRHMYRNLGSGGLLWWKNTSSSLETQFILYI